jgi:tRNA (guanine37-N1)-methyltransferase
MTTDNPTNHLPPPSTIVDDWNDEKYEDGLIQNWREHPAINPTLVFPTLLVPSESLQRWIQDPQIQPYLAKPTTFPLLQHIHPRLKMIQEFNETHKLVLLKGLEEEEEEEEPSAELDALLQSDDGVALGPPKHIAISFRQLSFAYILQQLLPVPPPSAYEQIGHVAHFNLKPHHMPFGDLIGQVLVETNPSIETVVTKIGNVQGKYRTYDLQVLAGPENHLETTVVEHGMSIRLNVADCYWCTRLSGERQHVLQELKESATTTTTTTTTNHPLVVADVFCGVGAICLLLAKEQPNATILANDWNPKAIEYFQESIDLNHFGGSSKSSSSRQQHQRPPLFQLSCGDTYDYLIGLGQKQPILPDHVLMNYPLEAATFLGALRWWPWKRIQEHFAKYERYPRFHVYTFARVVAVVDGDKNSKDEKKEEEIAIDIVANELLPPIHRRKEDDDDNTSSNHHRRGELNDEFDASVSTRLVRDVAPGKVVVCVSFSLTPKLVRYMQGDYS